MTRQPDENPQRLHALPFWGIHVAALLGIFWVGVTPALVGVAFLTYSFRMWAVTTGYHRYFSHRSFKTSRAFQFILAVAGSLALQKGPLWWAEHHRWHHGHADQKDDLHSPVEKGFFWAHLGWILCAKYEATDYHRIPDFARYPELRWLNRYYVVPPLVANALLWLFWGPAVFVWGALVSTVMSWHLLFTANSVCHMYGGRRFNTKDESRNNLFCVVFLLGEGWHNNHHRFPSAARQGFYWWEIDVNYYILRLLQLCGIVWEIREVPANILEEGRTLKLRQKATSEAQE